METASPRIVDVERLNGGVVVTFDDDRSVLYSASLLFAMILEAEVLPQIEDD